MELQLNANLPAEPTIRDIEKTVENALEALRHAPLNAQIVEALKFLTPPGFRPVAQLEEDGRKKRSTAAASNWNPETGEIVIYFERQLATPDTVSSFIPPPPGASSTSVDQSKLSAVSKYRISSPLPPIVSKLNSESKKSTIESTSDSSAEVSPLQVQQCCEALAQAEKAGKAFIALKWFRDEALLKYKFDWVATAEVRQKVLAQAIETGAIQTNRIPNPKAPLHPTTTVALNRTETPQKMTSRFNPVPVRGEPVSVTIMRDRGSI